MARYRVYATEDQIQGISPQIQVEETYPAFTIINCPSSVAAQLYGRFPLERIEVPATPAPNARVAALDAPLAAIAPGDGDRMAEAPAPTNRDFVVQFDGPVQPTWQEDLLQAGAGVLAPYGRMAVIASIPGDAVLQAVHLIPHVADVYPYVPQLNFRIEYLQPVPRNVTDADLEVARIAGAAVPPANNRNMPVPGVLIASFFTSQDRERATTQLQAQGLLVLDRVGDERLLLDVSKVADPVAALQIITAQPGLRSIEEKKIKTPFNDRARLVIGKGVVAGNPGGLGLDGTGEIVAVADTGLDTGLPATIHPDFQGRIKNIQSFPIGPGLSPWVLNPGGDDGPADIYSGHGTHVSGSVLGSGARSQGLGLSPIRGMAPGAELVFQAIEQTPRWTQQAVFSFTSHGKQPPKSGLFGIPDDIDDLFGPAYALGARIHSNSWGGGDPGVYDSQCFDFDDFIWRHKDFLVVVAAGNSGSDNAPPNGAIEPTSVDAPGIAKNCLTVGACENDRNGQFSATYGQWWPSDFLVAPFKDDPMVDSVDDVVAFSSRGPCLTGRRKPDVVAPGTFILSTRSSQIASNNFAWGAFPQAKQDYMFMGGTSMATPLVAGGAALVRQFLRNSVGIANPSAALLKASLIHSARYMQYRYADAGSATPADNEQGWGRVELGQVLAPAAPTEVFFWDQQIGLNTGQGKILSVKVTDSSVPLRITLAYTDYPGENLINNLNLIVTDPNGAFHVGNDPTGAGVPDAVNNVEGVIIQAPPLGTWKVKVVASDVVQGPQDFAVVLSGVVTQAQLVP